MPDRFNIPTRAAQIASWCGFLPASLTRDCLAVFDLLNLNGAQDQALAQLRWEGISGSEEDPHDAVARFYVGGDWCEVTVGTSDALTVGDVLKLVTAIRVSGTRYVEHRDAIVAEHARRRGVAAL